MLYPAELPARAWLVSSGHLVHREPRVGSLYRSAGPPRFGAIHPAEDLSYRSVELNRKLIPPGRLAEIRYEDLDRRPIETFETLYRELDLCDFEPAPSRCSSWSVG